MTKINRGFVWKFFEKNHTLYNLWRQDLLNLPPSKSICYGINCLVFGGVFIWNKFPFQVKRKSNFGGIWKYNLRYIHGNSSVCRWCICKCFCILIVTFISFYYLFSWKWESDWQLLFVSTHLLKIKILLTNSSHLIGSPSK